MGTNTLVKTLEAQVTESDTTAYEVGEQRERNYRYYSLQPLGNERKGRSQYISPDVLDAVESKKAIFSEAFLSARHVVYFSNCSYPGEAQAKTAYTNKVFRKNKYEQLFRDGWHDAFIAKRMLMLVEWKEDTAEETMQVQGMPLPQLHQQLNQRGDVLGVDTANVQAQVMPTPQGPIQIVSGELTLEVDDSCVNLELLAPEYFFRDPEAAYIEDSMWVTVEDPDVPRGRLVQRGFDREQVERLKQDYSWRRGSEESSRKAHDSSWSRRRRTSRTGSQELVTVYRTWTWLTAEDFKDVDLGEDFQPAEELTLYEIHWAHGEILKWTDGTYAIEEVEEIPVHEWSEMKVSHAENGLCTADVLAHTQKATSNLKRLVLDNQAIANSGRNTALKNSIVNPRDLLDNKIGATIWMKRPDAVGQLPPPALSPLTLETLQMMKRDSEERSGMSGLAKGMNTDAVKYQNADNMIERLTTAGQRRVTMAARDFATTFLIPLSQHIVHIAMEHDTGIDHMEVAGEQVPIAPQTWKDTALDMEAAVAITPEESAEAAQKLLTMHGLISQDEDMKMLYGLPQKHAVFDMVYDLLGLSDTSKVLLPPSSPEAKQKFQQRGQQAQQQQQLQQTMAQEDIKGKQLANQGTLAQIRALESGDQREWQKFMWDRTDDLTDNMLDERKQDHAEVIDLAELRMKEGETG